MTLSEAKDGFFLRWFWLAQMTSMASIPVEI